jgi:hypothetical protein
MGFMTKEAPPAYSGDLSHTSSRTSALPSYAASTAIPPSIDKTTLLPATFKVGKLKTKPFVTVPELKLHLRLLAAFDRLQQEVRKTPEAAGNVLDGDTRWAVFCTRAEKNYERWVQELAVADGEVEQILERGLPGLEVMMVWHAHMLNPRKYYEDTKRDPRFERLAQVGAFPLELVVSLLRIPLMLLLIPGRHGSSTQRRSRITRLTRNHSRTSCHSPRIPRRHLHWPVLNARGTTTSHGFKTRRNRKDIVKRTFDIPANAISPSLTKSCALLESAVTSSASRTARQTFLQDWD